MIWCCHTELLTGSAVGYDGALKMWDDKLQLVSAVKCAHEGARVHCLAVGPDGNLYTGGDDKVSCRGADAGHSQAAFGSQRRFESARRFLLSHSIAWTCGVGCRTRVVARVLTHSHSLLAVQKLALCERRAGTMSSCSRSKSLG